jgi:thioredoxin reductase (NADPH)
VTTTSHGEKHGCLPATCALAADRRDKGFARTGANIHRPLETSLPGVFAIGDVRSGSVKRVAAAVGEGAQVVAALHAFLAEAGDGAALPDNIRRD